MWTTSVRTNDCCRTVLASTSFWTVILSLIRLEWGSVQMKEASMRRTFCSGLAIFFRHRAMMLAAMVWYLRGKKTYPSTLYFPAARIPMRRVAKRNARILDKTSRSPLWGYPL